VALLEVHEVTKDFAGLRALDAVSLGVERGQIKSVIGPNGAGKSTLLNVVNGVLRASAGRIAFDGKDISGEPPHRICRLGLARTFQIVQVFPHMTVLQNIMVGCHVWTRGGILGSGLRLPHDRWEERQIAELSLAILFRFGLSEKRDLEARHLSYGEQRLVQIGRALASRPKLLMLDEPAAGLNSFEKEGLATKLLETRQDGVAILLVEHDMGVVMAVSDQIVVLDFGRKIAEGAPAEVRGNELVISAYLGEEVDCVAGS